MYLLVSRFLSLVSVGMSASTSFIVWMEKELTGNGFGLSPKFLTCLTSDTGLFFERWKPKPRIAVGGISPSAIPPKER